MLKIGDFSQIGQVSVRMLRHYDKLGLLTPGYVDEWTGYRYYEIDQLPRLHRILALRDLGLSLDQIATLLTEEALPRAQLRDMLHEKQQEVEASLREESVRLQRIATHLRHLSQLGSVPAYDVVLKKVPHQRLLGIRSIVPAIKDMPVYRDRMLRQLYKLLEDQQLPHGQEVVVYHLSGYSEEQVDMSMAVTLEPADVFDLALLPPFELLDLPAIVQAASIVHCGSILEISDVVSELYLWIGLNGFASTGPYREIHLFGRELEVCAGDIRKPVVYEIVVPVERLDSMAGPAANMSS